MPVWHKNSPIAVGKTCIHFTAGSMHGRTPGSRSMQSKRGEREPGVHQINQLSSAANQRRSIHFVSSSTGETVNAAATMITQSIIVSGNVPNTRSNSGT